MSETFDAYHKWLGIPSHEQPPHHYRLLAIDLYESDPDVIASAADQRMAHVRTFQSGRRSALSQTILNEIAVARVCLLNAEKKAAYDPQLQAELAARQEPQVVGAEPVAGAAESEVDLGPPSPIFDESGNLARWQRPPWLALGAVAVAVVAFVVVLALALQGDGTNEVGLGDPREPSPEQPAVPETPDDPEPVEPSPPEQPPEPSPVEPEPSPVEPEPSPVEPEPVVDVPSPMEPAPVEPAPVEPAPVEPAPVEPAPVEPARAPVPDAAAVAGAEASLEATLAGGAPVRLFRAALGIGREPVECYVLLDRARNTAAKAGDAKTALGAEEELVKRFAVDALATKADTLLTLSRSAGAFAGAQAIAEGCLALIDEALAAEDRGLAAGLATAALRAARQAGDSALERQATLRVLEVRSAQSSPDAAAAPSGSAGATAGGESPPPGS